MQDQSQYLIQIPAPSNCPSPVQIAHGYAALFAIQIEGTPEWETILQMIREFLDDIKTMSLDQNQSREIVQILKPIIMKAINSTVHKPEAINHQAKDTEHFAIPNKIPAKKRRLNKDQGKGAQTSRFFISPKSDTHGQRETVSPSFETHKDQLKTNLEQRDTAELTTITQQNSHLPSAIATLKEFVAAELAKLSEQPPPSHNSRPGF